MDRFCINIDKIVKGLYMVILIAILFFVTLYSLYVYFVVTLSRSTPSVNVIVLATFSGLFLVFLSIDIIHAIIDSFILISGGLSRKLKGFETCG